MKKLLLLLLFAPTFAFAGDLWEWAPGHYTYTDDYGNRSEGWQWAPGHTSWTDSYGRHTDIWEWAPGHYSVNPQ